MTPTAALAGAVIGQLAPSQVIVDGLVNGSGLLVRGVGGQLRRLQTGFVRNYAWAVVMGAALLLGWFVFRGSL